MLAKAHNQLRYLRSHPAYRGPVTIARFAAWQVLASMKHPVVVPFYGAKFQCPPERRGMAKMVYVFRHQYESEIDVLHKVVKPGMVVLDLGAHYGTYTLPLSRLVGPTGHVIAVEPSPHAISILKRNISLNGLTNVTVTEAAITNKQGEVDLHLHPDPCRTSLQSSNPNLEIQTVQAITIDSIRETLVRPVDFIKIDIEGAESLAFLGARDVLNVDRPVVLFESAPEAEDRMGFAAGAGWNALKAANYKTVSLGASAVGAGVENIFAFPDS